MIGGQRNEILLKLLPDQNQIACVSQQDFHAIRPFRTEDDDRSRERVLRKSLRCQGSKTVSTFATIDRLHGQHNARAGRDLDHRREAEARIARNTVVNVLPSMPGPRTPPHLQA